ncbi:MAG: endonuclease domain-containing protein [Anaerolineae bacterium]|nr:endonuclease domain-containing protein [Anaerolineae bacterium]
MISRAQVPSPNSSRALCGSHLGRVREGQNATPKRSNPKTKHNAIQLRKKLTPAERKLWSRIRNDQLGVTFRRQHAIGNFIPDFVCVEKKLILELDGSQHLEQVEYDSERTKYFETLGYKVVRFWNNDVTKNIDSVLTVILDTVNEQK